MKLGLIILLGLVAITASQPVVETAAVPIEDTEAAEDSAIDMMPEESALKIIMHKLDHWLKKCYKKGGCRQDYGHQSYGGYGHDSYGYGK
ncbi:hypothetical protein DAPPUDRAFT_241929 [Daphnia pulex]|uniref:Uncharacterized protein n=1 Tax=Daphnia pulex TaxID=6669 RepID=E9GFE7_DAPPU|nr:hypothetical protein DAPPUDRAFT_241929 [Daphnia pulex]|eukprot:EFX81629.1 hypothetical protein DAPPUDRAFT_241929 [Daphnia pulex]